MMKKLIFLLAWPVIGLLTSCALYAPQERSGLKRYLPSRFSLYSESGYDTTNRWWENFGSDELNGLIEEALTNSPTVRQAWARLAQADAVARKAGAERLPSLNYAGRANATWLEGLDDPVENYTLGLTAAYELDLWGRVRSTTEAAALDAEASRESLHTAAMTLTSRVALSWTALLAQRLQTDVIRQQLDANKTSLELIELRFRQSLSSALDVYQQRQTVAGTASLIPRAELSEELLRNELAVLLGRADFDSLRMEQQALPEIGPLPAVGIPADVLANRPDVRQAGLKLRAADWQVSAARADRLPAIRLTGSLDYSSSDLRDLFDNWAANLAASLTGPLFDGGRRKAEVARARAVAEERLEAYRETVLNAIREVEDALVSEQKQLAYIETLNHQLKAARRSYEESVNRYRNGMVEYTTVLIQLSTLQNLERTRVQAQYDLLRYRINLYKALGGAWPNDLSMK